MEINGYKIIKSVEAIDGKTIAFAECISECGNILFYLNEYENADFSGAQYTFGYIERMVDGSWKYYGWEDMSFKYLSDAIDFAVEDYNKNNSPKLFFEKIPHLKDVATYIGVYFDKNGIRTVTKYVINKLYNRWVAEYPEGGIVVDTFEEAKDFLTDKFKGIIK